jgi:hypothetical protein
MLRGIGPGPRLAAPLMARTGPAFGIDAHDERGYDRETR